MSDVTKAGARRRLPLAAGQYGIWLAQRIGAPRPVYNLAETVEIDGDLDVPRLVSAIRTAVSEAEALNVRITDDGDGPWQTVAPIDWTLPVIDLRGEPNAERAARTWIDAQMAEPADPARRPLFVQALLRTDDARHVWFQRYNHVVIDGYGRSLIERRVAEIYAMGRAGDRPPTTFGALAPLLAEDRAYRRSARYERDRTYWMTRFADRPEPVFLARGGHSDGREHRRNSLPLGEETAARLRACAAGTGASWSSVVVAATAAYLARMAGRRDVVFGVAVTGRTTSPAMRTPAMMSNILPIRVGVDPGATVPELTRTVRSVLLDVLRHQRFRGEELSRELGWAAGGRFRGPVVNVFTFDRGVGLPSCAVTAANISVNSVEDLSIAVRGGAPNGDLRIDFEGGPTWPGNEEFVAYQRSYLNFLKAVVRDPTVRICHASVLDDEEWHLYTGERTTQ